MSQLLWPSEKEFLFSLSLFIYMKYNINMVFNISLSSPRAQIGIFPPRTDVLTFPLLVLATLPVASSRHPTSHFVFLSPLPSSSTTPLHAASLSPHLSSIHLQPWRTTASRWCSSRHGSCASRWPTSACGTRAATSASSTRTPPTTRWRRCLFRCPRRRPRWRWSRRPWRAARWSSPACRRAASRPPPCAGFVTAGRYQVRGRGWWTVGWDGVVWVK